MSEDESLEKNLKSYEESLREEFAVSVSGTSEELERAARERLAQLLPEASGALLQILRNGDKDDAVRMTAIKTVFEYTIGKPGPRSTKENDMDKIIEKLMAKE